MAGREILRIAYFISPHGYGHAARAAAVMEALHALDPSIRFEIFTQVPRWFFEDSLSGDFGYHPVLADIGLVQKTPLQADLPETVRRLDDFLPLDRPTIKVLASKIQEMRCLLIICDIAPMGIVVAGEAGIPSVLVENFTWDWIYQAYTEHDARMGNHIPYLKGLFDAADFRIQAEPVCCPRASDLNSFPVGRKTKTPAHQIRKGLGIPDGARVVMITMGGIPEQYPFLEQLANKDDTYFVIPGARDKMQMRGNLLLLPHHSDYFHPDLVNASDAVIGKVGYSTVAEVYYAGAPFGYIARKTFPESPILVSYIHHQMKGLAIKENEFYNGQWLSYLHELLALPKIRRQVPQGAAQVSHFVYSLIKPIPS